MVTFIAQKPSFSSIMMYIFILGRKKIGKPRLMLGKIRPGSGRGFDFWPGPGPGRSLIVPVCLVTYLSYLYIRH